MATFSIKAGDTRPILEVVLRNPDGTVHDLTGATVFKLMVRLSPTTSFIRDMVKQGLDTAGTLRYTWVTADWDTGNVNGFLPEPPATYPLSEYPMEYEVSAGTSKLTFPNNSFDTLRILGDVA